MEIAQKIKNRITYNLLAPPLGISKIIESKFLKSHQKYHVNGNIIHNNQKWKQPKHPKTNT